MLLETENAEAAADLCMLTHSKSHSHFLVASIIQVNVRTVLAHGWLTACRVVPGADSVPGLSSQAIYTPNVSCIPWARKARDIYVDLVAHAGALPGALRVCWLNGEDVPCYLLDESAVEHCGLAEEARFV